MGALPGATLHVAGTGSGDEADRIRRRMEAMPAVVLHGQVDQGGLAALMRECDVCVLPSFYEGVPLVLVEAAACGCRLVSTDLPGVREVLAPVLGKSLTLVEPPAMRGIDTPHPGALPAFVERFARGIESALADRRPSPDTSPFTWTAVFRKVETVWRLLLDHPPPGRQNP
jgi:glycosyltransferase involved in cell wall biosynthesis